MRLKNLGSPNGQSADLLYGFGKPTGDFNFENSFASKLDYKPEKTVTNLSGPKQENKCNDHNEYKINQHVFTYSCFWRNLFTLKVQTIKRGYRPDNWRGNYKSEVPTTDFKTYPSNEGQDTEDDETDSKKPWVGQIAIKIPRQQIPYVPH